MKFLLGSIVVVLLVGLSTQDTEFTGCNAGHSPIYLQVNNCTKNRCVIHKGTIFRSEVKFTITEDTIFLKPQVTVFSGWWGKDIPFPQKDACVGLKDAKCPLKAGQNVTYGFAMPVPKSAPTIDDGALIFYLENDKEETALCFHVLFALLD